MKYIERIYPWLLISPVVLPIIIWGGLIYPYLVPKTLLFYALSLISIAIFAILVAHGSSFYWERLFRPTSWTPLTLLALAYIASFFGIDFYRSFWSLLVRGDGLLMLTFSVSSFYLILLSTDRLFFTRLLRAISIIGGIVAVYGIGEWLFGGGRVGSLLGNAAFFAGYLGIALFATFATARELASGYWQRLAYTAIGAELIAILLTATRGTILALGVALLLALVYGALTGNSSRRAWSGGALMVLIVVGGLFVLFRSSLVQIPFEPISRIASISTNDTDVASRLFIWKNMLGEIKQHPVLGVGAEHIDVLFNTFYNPTQIQEQWFDRSHNAFLDYAAQYGIGGLLLYLILIGSFFIAAYRFRKNGTYTYATAFALLAVVYAVQNFFVFDTISSFWLFLALLSMALAISGSEAIREPLSFPVWTRALSWPFALFLVFLIIPVSVRPALAAYDLSQAYLYQISNPTLSVTMLSQGMALRTYAGLEYGYQAYEMYSSTQRETLTGEALVSTYTATKNILIANFEQYPYDARTALYLAHILTLAPKGESVSKGLLSEALARAIKGSPNRYQGWYVLANLSISNANTYPAGSKKRFAGYAAARNILSRYLTLVPTLSEPHFVLADLFYVSGDKTNATKEAEKGKLFYKSSLTTAKRAVGYYEMTKNWADATFFLNKVISLDPNNYTFQYDLAKVQYVNGNPKEAVRIVKALRTKNPSILSTDKNFLKAITAYEASKK